MPAHTMAMGMRSVSRCSRARRTRSREDNSGLRGTGGLLRPPSFGSAAGTPTCQLGRTRLGHPREAPPATQRRRARVAPAVWIWEAALAALLLDQSLHELVILLRIHQGAGLAGVGQLDARHPSRAIAVLVDLLRRIVERGVALDHAATDGRVHIRNGLHRLHAAEGFTSPRLVVYPRQLDVDD